ALSTYFTPPLQELRASTFKQRITPPQSPPIIHTHFQPRFIPAHLTTYQHYLQHPPQNRPKQPPTQPLQPKHYIIQHPHIL
ncbi:DUF933 domain-containing protein, partial [Staphylococcus epidermidis]|uniref:DUF933 domain-containing protein n=1 Tax=Staphylococcus epidermidis TaxID=1282 RepID=UPI0011A96BCF